MSSSPMYPTIYLIQLMYILYSLFQLRYSTASAISGLTPML